MYMLIAEKLCLQGMGEWNESEGISYQSLFIGWVPAYLIILNRYYEKIIGKEIFIVSAFSYYSLS